MKESLLESLICPACENGSWQLECREPSGSEVVERGQLVCRRCGARYSISRGIVDLLPEPGEAILRERAGWEMLLGRSPEELNEAWLLSLPRIDSSVSSSPESIAHWKRQADNFELLTKHLNLSGNESVLELGAGRCWASAWLARTGCQVVALDVVGSKRAGGLEAGSVYLDHGTPHFERVLASMERLPFRQGAFDLLLSVASIHHTADLSKVVRQCARLLRPGGKLALTSEPCIRILKKRRVHNLETELGINEHVYNLLDYKAAFRRAGLSPTFYLPGAVVAMLREGDSPTDAGRFKRWLFGLVKGMWRREAVRPLVCSRPAIHVGLLFLEYGLTAIAEKDLGAKTR